MKFRFGALFVLLVTLISCNERPVRKAEPAPWTEGFWTWDGRLAAAAGPDIVAAPVDAIFAQVATISRFSGNRVPAWPRDLPPAIQYWAVWRFEPPEQPTESLVHKLVDDFERVRSLARDEGKTVTGLQLDYDCPTLDLRAYARFLHLLKKALPAGARISITALLDWFGPGTAARDLVAQVSEYVPQFYDTGEQDRGIAKAIDPARWAPIFNSLGTPYRIGISTFGRISLRQRGFPSYFRDLSPLDILGKAQLKEVLRETTPSGEMRFVQQAVVRLGIGYGELDPGDTVELVLPTRESVKTAYAAARKLGGLCSGVVFFRWPAAEETLVLTRNEVMNWTQDKPDRLGHVELIASEGDCVAVHCWDLKFSTDLRFPTRAATYRIQSSQPLEYFLPQRRVAGNVTVEGSSAIMLRLPPYHGHRSLSLGRAVTLHPATFLVYEADHAPN
jgi:hypothetical protein